MQANDILQVGTVQLKVLSAVTAAAELDRVVRFKGQLVVLRGLKLGVTYPLFSGDNFIGRADELPVDIDLDDQEPPDRVWSSRQHALLRCETDQMTIEDLKSANGTFVNRKRLLAGMKQVLKTGDVIQVGTVQMKLTE